MPETIFNNLPVWARPYAPTSNYKSESFSVRPKVMTLIESTPSQSVQNQFTVKFVADKPIVERQKVLIDGGKPHVDPTKVYGNTITVNKGVGFFGVVIDAKGYKKDEVQYMRQFPTDSFPLGVVSLDKAGRSVYSQRLQYGKNLIIAPQVLQLASLLSQFAQIQDIENLANFSLDSVNGRLYYPEIPADVGFLTIYQSCVMTFTSSG